MSEVKDKIERYDAGAIVPADPWVAMIERIVVDPNASLEKLEKMLDMKERLEDRAREAEDRTAKRAYYKAMAECQERLKVVVRNRPNEQTRSRYADLAALAAQADPIIHGHGFTVQFQPAGAVAGGEQIRWTIAHEAGHVDSDIAVIPSDAAGFKGTANKTATHAFGSTMSYGRRYLKMMLFDIATGDDDGQAAGKAASPLINADQYEVLKGLIEKAAADEAKMMTFIGAETLEELTVRQFDQAISMLRKKIAQQAATKGDGQ